MPDAPTIPPGYLENPQGNLVPLANVRPEDVEQNDLVLRLADKARALNEALAEFKRDALDDAEAFRQLLNEEYGVTKGGKAGNMTLRSFDGRVELQVAISTSISFGPELHTAKTLIDECIARWSEGSGDQIRVLVNQAFDVGKAGKIDTQRVLSLRKLEFDDDTWRRAMEAISNAIFVTGSKAYVRFYDRDPETDDKTPISLDLASV